MLCKKYSKVQRFKVLLLRLYLRVILMQTSPTFGIQRSHRVSNKSCPVSAACYANVRLQIDLISFGL